MIRAKNAMQETENVIRIGTSPMTPAQLLMQQWPKIQARCPDPCWICEAARGWNCQESLSAVLSPSIIDLQQRTDETVSRFLAAARAAAAEATGDIK